MKANFKAGLNYRSHLKLRGFYVSVLLSLSSVYYITLNEMQKSTPAGNNL